MRYGYLAAILLLIPSFSGTQTLETDDPYTNFLKFVSHHVRHWNPEIKEPEIAAYCWSTWQGCGENEEKAKLYFYVCLEERGMKYLDALNKHGGAGYSGAGYRVILRATDGKSRRWVKVHPFETNRALAAYFSGDRIGSSPKRWHSNQDEENNRRYVDNVVKIAAQCEGFLMAENY